MKFSATYRNRVLNPSYSHWKQLFFSDSMQVHRAHLVMLCEKGIVSRDTAREIRRGLNVLQESFSPPAEIPDDVEDLYFLVERSLSEIVGPEVAGSLHTARSRNDMDTTVFRLSVKRALLGVLDRVADCCEVLLQRSRSDVSTPFVLYTHGQPANVSTLGHYLSAFLLELLEGAERLLSAIRTVDRSTMGACALTTTGFPIDRLRVGYLLGFGGIVTNSYQAISTSHWLTHAASALADLLTDVTRFAADLSHKASSEVGVITFPASLIQVSSIMPQKRNPVIIEHTRIQAGLSRGALRAVEELFLNVPYQDVNELGDSPVVRLLEGTSGASSCLDLLCEIARNLQVDEQRAKRIAVECGTTTTELADMMVRDYQISFRQAHSIVQEFAEAGYDKEVLRQKFSSLTGQPFRESDELIDDALSAERFIAVRENIGGPAVSGMAPVFVEAEESIGLIRATLDRAATRARRSAKELDAAYASL